MRGLSLAQVAGPLRGRLLGADRRFGAVSTDSRQVARGELFVALPGERFDGHDFVAAAGARGASAALVSRPGQYPLPCLQVADTARALGALGQLNRDGFAGALVGITGSNGKTTAKNMLAGILARRGGTLATRGNFNNRIGLPLTLSRLAPRHRYAVVEMGASRAGDIAYLAGLARPDVAVLLNAQAAHLEGFGSLREVAEAKGEIYQSLGPGGSGVLNADSEFSALWRELLGARSAVSFGLSAAADWRASAIRDEGARGCAFALAGPAGRHPVRLRLAGAHNVGNALAAAAAAAALGVAAEDIVAGLESTRAAPGRLCVGRAASGALVIDDSYNANPGSVRAAIDVLVKTPGRHCLILGAMAELGEDSEALHRQVGDYARRRGVECLWLVGGAAPAARGFGARARVFAAIEELPDPAQRFAAGDAILVKGSRGAAMERVVAMLEPQPGGV